jgi:hypothetical protein
MVELLLITSSARPCSMMSRPPWSKNGDRSGLVASVMFDTSVTRAM